MLLPWLSDNFPARYSSIVFLIVTIVGVVCWTWAVKGTWASASKHVKRGGSSGWAAAAKFMIVLSTLRTVEYVATLLPTLGEHVVVASGHQPGADTSLEIRADGRSVLVSGGINDGSAEQLERILKLAPAIKTVVFSSEGGWIREGQLLAEVIREHGLNTYVEDSCSSACTIAFLAGKDRAAAPGARIGFHASKSVGNMDREPSAAASPELYAVYRNAGLPDYFVQTALETPNDGMWYPAHEDLLSAGVLTRKSVGGETAALSTTVRSKETLIAELKMVEIYAALAERSPQSFDEMTSAMFEKMQQGATDAAVQLVARTHIIAAVGRHAPQASDETLAAYLALVYEQMEALRTRDVGACAEMMFSTGNQMRIVSNLPTELKNRELALMIKVFREADRSRSFTPSERDSERIAEIALAGMTDEQILIVVNETAQRESSPALLCDAAISFYASLNSVRPAERGRIARIMFASN